MQLLWRGEGHNSEKPNTKREPSQSNTNQPYRQSFSRVVKLIWWKLAKVFYCRRAALNVSMGSKRKLELYALRDFERAARSKETCLPKAKKKPQKPTKKATKNHLFFPKSLLFQKVIKQQSTLSSSWQRLRIEPNDKRQCRCILVAQISKALSHVRPNPPRDAWDKVDSLIFLNILLKLCKMTQGI